MARTDRVVLVTGSTGDLGPTVVTTFARAGARLGLVGTDRGRLERVAADTTLRSGRWTAATADLRDARETARAIEEIEAGIGRIDIVLHLVGGWTGGTRIADLDPGEMAAMLDQHLWTTLNVARVTTPRMVERGWGRFIAVSSPVAADGATGVASYSVAKAAEEALLRTLARELAGSGVTANVVVVRTIAKLVAAPAAGAAAPGAAPATGGKGTASTGIRTAGLATPDEIAAAMLYLCSDEAGIVNGARIPLTGRV